MYRFSLLLLVTLAAGSPSVGLAAVIVSTNPLDFVLTAQSFGGSNFTNGNLTSLSGAITLDNALGVGDPFTQEHAYLDWTGGLPGPEYLLNGDENFDVLFSTAQTAFAFDYSDDGLESLFTLNFFSGTNHIGSTSFTSVNPFGPSKFVGFISDTSFNRIQVRENDGTANSDEYFQFYTAEAAEAAAVPEPASTVYLLTGGLLGCLAIGRRSRKRQPQSPANADQARVSGRANCEAAAGRRHRKSFPTISLEDSHV